jgi:hypothetical protein
MPPAAAPPLLSAPASTAVVAPDAATAPPVFTVGACTSSGIGKTKGIVAVALTEFDAEAVGSGETDPVRVAVLDAEPDGVGSTLPEADRLPPLPSDALTVARVNESVGAPAAEVRVRVSAVWEGDCVAAGVEDMLVERDHVLHGRHASAPGVCIMTRWPGPAKTWAERRAKIFAEVVSTTWAMFARSVVTLAAIRGRRSTVFASGPGGGCGAQASSRAPPPIERLTMAYIDASFHTLLALANKHVPYAGHGPTYDCSETFIKIRHHAGDAVDE